MLTESGPCRAAGSNLYNKLNPGANLTSLGFRGPRAPRTKAVFEPPLEPVFHYDTVLGFATYPYAAGHKYDAEVCARACNARTAQAQAQAAAARPPQYRDGAYDKCNMFTVFELFRDDVPHAMVCLQYSAVWDDIYGTWTGDVAPDGQRYAPRLVEVYARADYPAPAICADEAKCGGRFHPGGDCSGWGGEYCSEAA